eukprot:GHVU01161525.1.p1 GENE.GHVU01161525.1~~GHVU01161525.1.p1  ORF type:complete len:184 (-),score=21.74 GHVU01161525.1:360-911(-)
MDGWMTVDDQWRWNSNEATCRDKHNNINNVIDISHYERYQFHIPSDFEQERMSTYHQNIPECTEYQVDAPNLPILLSKSTSSSAYDPPPLPHIPLHCASGHIYHDATAANAFGPHVSCVASTQRWRTPGLFNESMQRYTTYLYVTINPLFPTAPSKEYWNMNKMNPLRAILTKRNDSSASGKS